MTNRKIGIIALIIFVVVTLMSFILRDDPFENSSGVVQLELTAQRSTTPRQFAVREYADTHHGRNHVRAKNYYKPYSPQLRMKFKRAWRNMTASPAVAKRCCDFDLPTPSEAWHGFVEGAGDGLMCAMYKADSNLEAAECAGETIGKGVKAALYDPTQVLVKATVGCVQDAATGTVVAATWAAGAIMVRDRYRAKYTLNGIVRHVWRNRWVLVENNVGKVPKGLYICWAATYAKHVLAG